MNPYKLPTEMFECIDEVDNLLLQITEMLDPWNFYDESVSADAIEQIEELRDLCERAQYISSEIVDIGGFKD